MPKLKNNLRPCPVLGCTGWRKPTFCVCPRCWIALPSELRQRVSHLFVTAPGSPEHKAAIDAAVRSVPGLAVKEILATPVAGETSMERTRDQQAQHN